MLGRSFVHFTTTTTTTITTTTMTKSHSSVCCLLSNLNFELLKSVTYALCARVRAVHQNQILLLTIK